MRRAVTDTEPVQRPTDPPESAADAPESASPPAGAEVELLARARAAAGELAELLAAFGGLARAEASLSLAALVRIVELRALGSLLIALALVLASAGATLALAEWLGSLSAALFAVAGVALLGAGLLLWRARAWRERIGFEETRAALVAEPPPSRESGP